MFDTVDMLTVHRKGKRHLEGKTLHLISKEPSGFVSTFSSIQIIFFVDFFPFI